MRSCSSSLGLLCAILLLLCSAAWGQDTFTGSRGFAPTFKTLSDIPVPKANLSIQVPGFVELNGCVRFTKPTGQACLCYDENEDQIWHETDCNGEFDGGFEFFIGTGGGSGGGAGKVITDAADAESAFIVGNGTNGWRLYADENNAYLECFISGGACPPDIVIPPGEALRFLHDTLPMLTLDPEAASRNLMWLFGAGYEPLLSAEMVLRPAGNCTVAEEAIVTNDPLAEWITCADTTGDSVAFSYRVTGKIATDTTAQITLLAVNKNAAPTGTFTLACAARSVRPGLDAYLAHSTTGQQNVSFTTFDTQSRPETASATFTLNGTVATGAHIKGQCNVTAAPGQIADIRLSGTAVIELFANSLSD